MIRWRKETTDPKTPDIKAAQRRALNSQDQANSELASAKRLATALAKIRQEDPFGDSFSKVFGE